MVFNVRDVVGLDKKVVFATPTSLSQTFRISQLHRGQLISINDSKLLKLAIYFFFQLQDIKCSLKHIQRFNVNCVFRYVEETTNNYDLLNTTYPWKTHRSIFNNIYLHFCSTVQLLVATLDSGCAGMIDFETLLFIIFWYT